MRYNVEMSIEPIKIPQNVQIEDRIIGPVTLRQLIITVVGCGISYAIWSNLEKALGTVSITVTIIAWIPAVIFVAFAFVKVYDVSLLRFILLIIERSTHPQTRLWTPRAGTVTASQRVFVEGSEKKAPGTEQKKQPNIEELSSMLDIYSQETPKPPSAPTYDDRVSPISSLPIP